MRLSQRAYVDCELNKFSMVDCKSKDKLVVKGDISNLAQSPKNDIVREFMKAMPYTSAIWSLIFTHVCK